MNPFNSREEIPEEFTTFKEEWYKRAEEIKSTPLPPIERRQIENRYQIQKIKLKISFPSHQITLEMLNFLSSVDSEIETALALSGGKYEQTQKGIKEKMWDALKEGIKTLGKIIRPLP